MSDLKETRENLGRQANECLRNFADIGASVLKSLNADETMRRVNRSTQDQATMLGHTELSLTSIRECVDRIIIHGAEGTHALLTILDDTTEALRR